jgi:enoyl-CoA hydratase/carnithine racemase
MSAVTVEDRGIIRINRTESMSVIRPALANELQKAFKSCEVYSEKRFAVLSAAAKKTFADVNDRPEQWPAIPKRWRRNIEAYH